MVRQVIWLPEAVHDLREISGFITSRSEAHGRIVSERIVESTDRLELTPYIGACIREDMTGRHRHMICYSYRIIYRIIDNDVYIVAVIHGARLLPDDLLAR